MRSSPHASDFPGPWPWAASTAGPGATRPSGTSRYAGTDIISSVSNTTLSRRYPSHSTDSSVSSRSGTRARHGPEQRVEAGPAPLAPLGQRLDVDGIRASGTAHVPGTGSGSTWRVSPRRTIHEYQGE